MRLTITGMGDWNAEAYRLLTREVPLRDFLDIEELALVERDRKLAWEIYLSRHPEVLRPGGGDR